MDGSLHKTAHDDDVGLASDVAKISAVNYARISISRARASLPKRGVSRIRPREISACDNNLSVFLRPGGEEGGGGWKTDHSSRADILALAARN